MTTPTLDAIEARLSMFVLAIKALGGDGATAEKDIARLLAIARAAEQLIPVLKRDLEFPAGTTAYELLMALEDALKGTPSASPR